jgi:hypothetical protein
VIHLTVIMYFTWFAASNVRQATSYTDLGFACLSSVLQVENTVASFLQSHFLYMVKDNKIRDSSVGTALGYGLDDRGSRVRFPAGAGNFSLHHRVQNSSWVHPASYPMGTRGFFPAGRAAGGVKLTTHFHLEPRSKNTYG